MSILPMGIVAVSAGVVGWLAASSSRGNPLPVIRSEITTEALEWSPSSELRVSPTGEHTVRVAPQGDYLTYWAGDTLVARPFPEIGPPVTLTIGRRRGDVHYSWGPDGSTIFYSGPEQALRRIRLTRDPTLAVIDDESVIPLGYDIDWDLHPDGDKIVAAVPALTSDTEDSTADDDPSPDAVYLVSNWFERIRAAFAREGG